MGVIKAQGILWPQVVSLTLVQAAISLTWLIYGLYLPQLLAGFGFPETLAGVLLVIENGLAAILEPVMGGVSDLTREWMGNRLPLISIGVILASALFISIPVVTLFGNSSPVWRGLFLGVLVAWAIAMAIFRAPAIRLLGQYANPLNLPQAASFLTLAGGVVGALRPFTSQFLLQLGPAVVFTVGSLVLLGAVGYLRTLHPPVPQTAEAAPPSSVRRSWLLLQLTGVAALGLVTAWGVRLTMGEVFPRVLKAGIVGADLNLLMGVASIVLAILALPMGALGSRVGNQRLLFSNFVLIAICLAALVSARGPFPVIGLTLLTLACLAGILNGMVPVVLEWLPAPHAGLGVGMYFGGFSASMSLFGVFVSKPAALPLSLVAFWGATAFLLASFCLFLGHRFQLKTVLSLD